MSRDLKAHCKHGIIRNMSKSDWTSGWNLSIQSDVAHSACITLVLNRVFEVRYGDTESINSLAIFK
jgi:hypothetical protein